MAPWDPPPPPLPELKIFDAQSFMIIVAFCGPRSNLKASKFQKLPGGYTPVPP